jgi:hypothetical protein
LGSSASLAVPLSAALNLQYQRHLAIVLLPQPLPFPVITLAFFLNKIFEAEVMPYWQSVLVTAAKSPDFVGFELISEGVLMFLLGSSMAGTSSNGTALPSLVGLQGYFQLLVVPRVGVPPRRHRHGAAGHAPERHHPRDRHNRIF